MVERILNKDGLSARPRGVETCSSTPSWCARRRAASRVADARWWAIAVARKI